MKKQRMLACIACMLIALGLWSAALAADILTGEWKGSADVSGVPFALSVTAKFNEDATFSLSTFGLSAKGTYSTDGQNLSLAMSEISGIFAGMLQAPKDIGTITVPLTFKEDGSVALSASTQGFSASVSMKRK